MTIKLGDEARDTITKFRGVVVAEYKYLNGCVRLAIQPQKLEAGKPVEAQTFDVEQVELVKAAKPRTVKPSGGPHPTPQRQAIPSR